MQFLALLVFLFSTGDLANPGFPPQFPDTDPALIDLCQLGRRIADLEPCTDPESCGALQIWKNLYGPPAPRFVIPGGADARGSVGSAALEPESPRGAPRVWHRQVLHRDIQRTRHCRATDEESMGPDRP